MIHMLDTYRKAAMYRFGSDSDGAVATEYIVLLVFIALAIIAAVTLLGNNLTGAFNSAAARIF